MSAKLVNDVFFQFYAMKKMMIMLISEKGSQSIVIKSSSSVNIQTWGQICLSNPNHLTTRMLFNS